MDKNQINHLEDESLINQFLETGDKRLLSVLYKRYAEDIYRKCISMLKEPESAKDLTHDIFLRAFLKLADLKDPSRFKYWLKTIAYNFCINYLNLKKSFQTSSLDEQYDLSAGDDSEKQEKIIAEMNLDQLELMMAKLPEADRLILLMRYQDELSIQDIQESLGIGASAAKMRLKRAKEKLAKLFQEFKSKIDA